MAGNRTPYPEGEIPKTLVDQALLSVERGTKRTEPEAKAAENREVNADINLIEWYQFLGNASDRKSHLHASEDVGNILGILWGILSNKRYSRKWPEKLNPFSVTYVASKEDIKMNIIKLASILHQEQLQSGPSSNDYKIFAAAIIKLDSLQKHYHLK